MIIIMIFGINFVCKNIFNLANFCYKTFLLHSLNYLNYFIYITNLGN